MNAGNLKNWFISQKWSDVVFINFVCDDVDKLQKLIPFELDLYDGQAILSIVPFKMSEIGFSFLNPLPFGSNLNELNLRTYVKVDGVSGIYFLTLESNHYMANLIAKHYFNLPYSSSKIQINRKDDQYHVTQYNNKFNLKLSGLISHELIDDELSRWCVERYSLFLKKAGVTYQGIACHEPWKLNKFKIIDFRESISSYHLKEFCHLENVSSYYCSSLLVTFDKFIKC